MRRAAVVTSAWSRSVRQPTRASGLSIHELLATTNGSDENSVTRRLLVPVLSKGVHRLFLYTRRIGEWEVEAVMKADGRVL